jgi:Rod binding domain-containing protein
MIHQALVHNLYPAGESPRTALSKKPGAAAGGEEKHAEFKKVAKEMESLFAYQLLQIMRKTEETLSDEEKGAGYSTYMGMFDMEVSKLLADRGLGMQDAIIQWLERTPGANDK